MLAKYKAEVEDRELYNEWTEKYHTQKILYEAKVMRWEALRTRANCLENWMFNVDEWNSQESSANEEEEERTTDRMRRGLNTATCSDADPHLDTVYTGAELEAARISAEKWYLGEKRTIETQSNPVIAFSKYTNTLPFVRGSVRTAVT